MLTLGGCLVILVLHRTREVTPMVHVDITDTGVTLTIGGETETLTLSTALALITDLTVGVQLVTESPGPVSPAVKRKKNGSPSWHTEEPGSYFSTLEDGRILRVYRTKRGWVGEINETPINPTMPVPLKEQAKKIVLARI